MKEDSKRLLRGMTEVRDQYILEAEFFYQEKEDLGLAKESVKKREEAKEEKECTEKERIDKEKKRSKIQDAKKKKILTLPRVLGISLSIAAACMVLFIRSHTHAPKSGSPGSFALEGTQGENSDGATMAEEVDSLQKAKELTGFDLRIPEGKEPFTKKTFTVIEDDMIDVRYSQEATSALGYDIRKARGEGDISGDYTKYAETQEVDLKARKVTLKGEAGTYSLALWEENGFSYAVRAGENPMTKEEILEIVGAVD